MCKLVYFAAVLWDVIKKAVKDESRRKTSLSSLLCSPPLSRSDQRLLILISFIGHLTSPCILVLPHSCSFYEAVNRLKVIPQKKSSRTISC